MTDSEILAKLQETIKPEQLGIPLSRWNQFIRELRSIFSEEKSSSRHLTMYIDGAARGNPGRAGIGIVCLDERGKILKEYNEYIGEQTNNAAEYRALLTALEMAKGMGALSVSVITDSELLAKQMNGSYRVKNSQLLKYYLEAEALLKSMEKFEIGHVPRRENRRADRLANLAIDKQNLQIDK